MIVACLDEIFDSQKRYSSKISSDFVFEYFTRNFLLVPSRTRGAISKSLRAVDISVARFHTELNLVSIKEFV